MNDRRPLTFSSIALAAAFLAPAAQAAPLKAYTVKPPATLLGRAGNGLRGFVSGRKIAGLPALKQVALSRSALDPLSIDRSVAQVFDSRPELFTELDGGPLHEELQQARSVSFGSNKATKTAYLLPDRNDRRTGTLFVRVPGAHKTTWYAAKFAASNN